MAVTGGEPISAANLSAAIASAVQSAVAQATAGAKTYTDQQIQELKDEQSEIANTYYNCEVEFTFEISWWEIDKSNESSFGGISVSYANMPSGSGRLATRATVTATVNGSYDVMLDGAFLGRFGGSSLSFTFDISAPDSLDIRDGAKFVANVFVQRVA